jgi:hypothetical protein
MMIDARAGRPAAGETTDQFRALNGRRGEVLAQLMLANDHPRLANEPKVCSYVEVIPELFGQRVGASPA